MPKHKTKPQGATSFKETAFGIIPRSKLLILEIEGTKKGLEHISSLVSKNKVEFTPTMIKDLHRVSFGWIFPDWGGKFRTIQVTYSDKEAPQYFQVPGLIENLCADLQIRLKNFPNQDNEQFIDAVVELLAWFQHKFVFIHPFVDYNGRTARMLTVLLLLRFNLPALEIRVDTKMDRKKYLESMQKGDEGDLILLENLISETLNEALGKSII
jgi:Fic family protein